MSVSSRFSDPQYVNWLRCASSLVILKESLHDYIEAGVRRLHNNVKHNVTTQLGAQYQCSDCSWKGIRLKYPKGTWSIKCNNNICKIWLGEILKKHDDPQCKTINWGNADITKWSNEPWEIAKIFMTNGQRNKTDLPKEYDTQALLSLLKFCKEFHPIDVQLVSDIIEIRNKVFHSPDLRVSDTDKDSWMNCILSLVSDLNIQGGASVDIDKLKTEDISVGFKDQEIKILQNLVSEVQNDVSALKGDIDSLMNAQSQHKEDIEKVKEDAGDKEEEINGLKMQSQQLETDFKGQKSQMESYAQVILAMRTFIDNNSDLSKIKIAEELEATSKEIHSLQAQLQNFESQLQDIKGELSFIKCDQEKLRRDQEAIKTEIMAEHQELKGEIIAVKEEIIAIKEEISADKGSSNVEVRNHAQSSDLDVQELFGIFDSILKFIASKSGGVKAKDVSENCKLGPSRRGANPLLYFLREKQLLVFEQVAGSQKKIWKLGPKPRPSDQELRDYAAEKFAKGRR